MLSVSGILETSLYVDDVARSAEFYRRLFGFDVLVQDERICALSVAGRDVLLLFKKGASLAITAPHDGDGQLHFAFRIAAGEWDAWVGRLAEAGVAIESTVEWPLGGRSLYFRDPDGHLAEPATPGTWAIY